MPRLTPTRPLGSTAVIVPLVGYGTAPLGREEKNQAMALRYALGLPGVSLAIVGLDSIAQIDEVVANASSCQPLSEAELQSLIEEVRPTVEKDARDNQQGKSELF